MIKPDMQAIDDATYKDRNVKAWRPLPAPYQEDEA